MTNRSLEGFPTQVLAWAVVVVLGGLTAFAQTPTPSASPSALPDSPSPAVAPSHPRPPAAVESQPELTPPSHPVETGQAPPITILEDTMIRVMTNDTINSKHVKDGTPILCTVSEDVLVGDTLAIPRGAMVHAEVLKSKKAGVLTGRPELTLKLVSLDLGGRTYPLYSHQFRVTGMSKTRPTEIKAVRGAAIGATTVAVARGVVSDERANSGIVEPTNGLNPAAAMATGAAIGAGVGTAVSAATPGPGIFIPSEAQIDFYLSSPITVAKVSAKEAARLEQGLHAGGPSLYVRGDTP